MAPAPLVLSVSACPRIQCAACDKDTAQSYIERCFLRYSQQSQQDPTDHACRYNQQRKTKDEKKGSKPFVQAWVSDTQRSVLSSCWMVHASFSAPLALVSSDERKTDGGSAPKTVRPNQELTRMRTTHPARAVHLGSTAPAPVVTLVGFLSVSPNE